MYFSNNLLNGIQLDVNFPEKAAFTSTTKDTGRAEFVFVIAQFADCYENSGTKRRFIPFWPRYGQAIPISPVRRAARADQFPGRLQFCGCHAAALAPFSGHPAFDNALNRSE
jgi:hypothetical protein